MSKQIGKVDELHNEEGMIEINLHIEYQHMVNDFVNKCCYSEDEANDAATNVLGYDKNYLY